MNQPEKYKPNQDPWALLKQFTDARIALGRTGISIPLQEVLQFKQAHALARDAVFFKLDTTALSGAVAALGIQPVILHSTATNRAHYLQRPDLGRILDQQSRELLEGLNTNGFDIAITIADGLSALAIEQHALQVLKLLIPELRQRGFSIAPVCIVEQGRVAIADETGALLKAKLSLVLIGERPGLSSPDSMGAYLTLNPKPGLTDEMRNCISNIRLRGLIYPLAVSKILYIITEAFRLQLTGTQLKDRETSFHEPPGNLPRLQPD